MARVGQHGGEHNDATDGAEAIISSNASIVTTPTQGSRYAWRLTWGDGVAAYARLPHGNSADGKIFYKFDFYVDNGYSSWLCQFAYTTTKRGGIQFTGGALRLKTAGGVFIGATSATVTTDTWHTVKCSYDAATGNAEFYLDDVYVDNQNLIVAGQNIDNIYFGFLATTQNFYFDNVLVNDDNGTDDNSYPDINERLVYAHPNATMTEPATTGGGAGSLYWQKQAGVATSGTNTNWQNVDENPPDDLTTYVRKNSNNEFRDWYPIENIATIGYPASGDTIKSLAVGGRMGGNGTTDRFFRYIYETAASGTGIQRSGNFNANVNAMFWYHATGASGQPPWIIYPSSVLGSALDAYQIGCEADDANSRQIQMSALWLEVSYIPAIVKRNLASLGVGR